MPYTKHRPNGLMENLELKSSGKRIEDETDKLGEINTVKNLVYLFK